ncbi:hypothetical protein V5S96_03805 [Corynebacterium mastitidis]|uniref:Delta-aminolevulinic acid dehydratase n=1 Tax=Corynebacterium mastitidis TaxID=161890 RepID=A0ABU8NWU5_9CORY
MATRSSEIFQRLPESTVQRVTNAVKASNFRRLTEVNEVSITPSDLIQSMHIGRLNGDSTVLIGNESERYLSHSIDSAKAEIDDLLSMGIRKVYLQLYTDADLTFNDAHAEALEHHVAVTSHLQNAYGKDLDIIVDTAGLCMGSDIRWGVRSADHEIDPQATIEFLALAAFQIAQAGASALCTVGRFNHEAEVARAAIDLHNDQIELWAFSTNSETPNAYFDVTSKDMSRPNTGQKLRVGNLDEMLLRAVQDLCEGVTMMLQKPIESRHVLTEMNRILSSEEVFIDWLSQPRIQSYITSNSPTFAGTLDTELNQRHQYLKVQGRNVGAYEVSGTYTTSRMIEKTYGTGLAWAMAHELFREVKSSAGDRFSTIVTRGARWFVSNFPESTL